MLTRRAALKGGTATVAAIAGAGAVAARVAVEDPVVALEHQWRAAREERGRQSDFWDSQRKKLPAFARPGPDQFSQMSGFPDVGVLPEFQEFCSKLSPLSTRPSLSDVEGYNKHTESLSGGEERERRRAQGLGRVRAWKARQKQRQDLERELGIDDWDDKMEPYNERIDAIECEMMDTPAQSVAGMAVKLRIFALYVGNVDLEPEEDSGLDWHERFAISAFRDAERLAGEA